MSKIDYAILADIIRSAIQSPGGSMPKIDATNPAACRSFVQCAHSIARNFANRSSVDRAAFLHACGIDVPAPTGDRETLEAFRHERNASGAADAVRTRLLAR